MHLGCTEGGFIKWCYKFRSSFKLEGYKHYTKLASHVLKLKKKHGKRTNICWSMLIKAKTYSIGNIMYRLCQERKLALMLYPEHRNLLNESSERMLVCKYTNWINMIIYCIRNKCFVTRPKGKYSTFTNLDIANQVAAPVIHYNLLIRHKNSSSSIHSYVYHNTTNWQGTYKKYRGI